MVYLIKVKEEIKKTKIEDLELLLFQLKKILDNSHIPNLVKEQIELICYLIELEIKKLEII